VSHLDQLRIRIVGEQDAATDGAYVDLGQVDGGEHVLERGGHQLQVLAIATEVVHDDQGSVLEVIVVDHLLFG